MIGLGVIVVLVVVSLGVAQRADSSGTVEVNTSIKGFAEEDFSYYEKRWTDCKDVPSVVGNHAVCNSTYSRNNSDYVIFDGYVDGYNETAVFVYAGLKGRSRGFKIEQFSCSFDASRYCCNFQSSKVVCEARLDANCDGVCSGGESCYEFDTSNGFRQFDNVNRKVKSEGGVVCK